MEDNNKTELFFKQLFENKLRFAALITGLISVIWTFIYISQSKLIAPVLIAMLFILLAGLTTVIYTIDINNTNPHSSNILVLGMALSLAAFLIRLIQMGFGLSWQSFIYYGIGCLALILLSVKLCKKQGTEKIIIVILIALVFYDLFCFFYYRNTYFKTIVWKMFFLSEGLLFSSYAMILMMLKDKYGAFSDNLGAYKTQIPSAKLCLIILAVVSALSVGIGFLYSYVKNPPKDSSVADGTITKQEQENSPTPVTEAPSNENAAIGTVVRGSSSDSGSDSATAEDTKNSEEKKAEGTKSTESPEITPGQTVTSKDFEFTVNKVVFSHKVEPDVKPSYYRYYDAESGHVYIYVNAKVKNLQQSSVESDEIYSVTADYDNGYTYSGFNIVNDSDGDFTYANITSLDPLQTNGVHCLIDCPEEVETSEKPLVLTFQFKDGSKYIYKMR